MSSHRVRGLCSPFSLSDVQCRENCCSVYLSGYLVVSRGKVNRILLLHVGQKAKFLCIGYKCLLCLRIIPQVAVGTVVHGEHNPHLNRAAGVRSSRSCHNRVWALHYHLFHLFPKKLDFLKLFLILKHSVDLTQLQAGSGPCVGRPLFYIELWLVSGASHFCNRGNVLHLLWCSSYQLCVAITVWLVPLSN